MAERQDNQDHLWRGTPIIIDDNPMVFWDRDNSRTQVDFLKSIDPTYFRYLASIHESQLEGEDGLSAAVALRVTYSHAVESLFAFIGAAIQAPRCPAGWLLMYKNADLKNLIEKISDREPFLSKWNLERAGWREVAGVVLPWSTDDDDGNELRDASTRFWKSLAHEIVDKSFTDEYNSLKHGLRVRSGEWFLNIGAEDVPGTPPPPERMRQMASSRFGSNYLRALPLKKYHWSFEDQRVNWNPAVFARRIPLVVDGIDNVLTLLKNIHGVPLEELSVSFITHEAVSQALTDTDHSSSMKFAFRHRIDPETIASPTREDILEAYLKRSRPRSDPHATQ